MVLQIEDLSEEILKLRAMRTPFYSNKYKTIMTSWQVYLCYVASKCDVVIAESPLLC